jgi:hypothetical protein
MSTETATATRERFESKSPMRKHVEVLTAAALLASGAFACGSSHTAKIQSPARVERAPGGTRIVVSANGAQRIGLRTARAHKAGGPTVAVPFSALVYDPSGKTYAFVAVRRLTYREMPVTVAHIDGDTAYLQKGLSPGAQVVSTGAEELYGVQTGVLGQT